MSRKPDPVTLRAGSVADLDAVSIVMREAFDARFGEAWTPAQCLGMLSLPGVWLTLAEHDEGLAGFALSRSVMDEGELLLIATRPAARGRGVGGMLLRSVIDEARRRTLSRLHLEVRAGNAAVELYKREGFAKVGERPRYYRGRAGEAFDAHSYARTIP
ncbi:ribosomal protein S18-alanine N-acetyltransferase [Sphingomonas desiccabilis]|nr:ribosomal protein S18-alanine N-acetyltransferase [Sphingomonas desiccabilis]MBB3912512.1 ribosomal-protein-alanine N-acetyltransferase [Sphingomonas desiccabilis]